MTDEGNRLGFELIKNVHTLAQVSYTHGRAIDYTGLEIPSSPVANAMRNGEGLQLSHIS